MPAPASVAVVVVNWNGAHLLPACLDGLAAQTRRDFELVVVDNGSTDGSVDLVHRRVPGARIIRNDRNLGFAAASNQGILATRAPFVATLNNDAIPEPGWLEALLQCAEPRPGVGAVASRMVFADHPHLINSDGIALDLAGIAWDRHGGQPARPGDQPRPVFGACAGAALYRRAALDQVGLFDERFFAYLEDVDLAWRLRLAGWECLLAPQAVVHHAHSATGREGSPFKSYHLGRNKVWTIFKNYPAPALYWLLPLILAYDLAATIYGVLSRRDLAALRGRLAGLTGLRSLASARAEVQRRRVLSSSAFLQHLSPLPPPWRVPRRYRHLNHLARVAR